jgi:ArsR family transcriptional regulator, arsenate/arsenite/antimonite-responsive transcriptional repressor / arsenate reductase (thioredoxin)
MYLGIMVPSGQQPPEVVRLAAHPVRWRLMTELAMSDYRVRELAQLIQQPQNLVSYHLRRLREEGLVDASRSSFDGRDSYYRLNLDRYGHALAAAGAAVHPAVRLEMTGPGILPDQSPPVAVLFACTGNSARSPIAEALLRRQTAGRVDVASAGSHPKPRLHPAAVRVLREEYDIDIGEQSPRSLDTLTERRFDHVITLCDKVREICPELPHHPRRAHWSIPDPVTSDRPGNPGYQAFRDTAAQINARVQHLVPVLAQPTDMEVRP